MARSVTLASLALLALAPVARSQEYREVLTAQFQAVQENMAPQGWSQDGSAFPGDIAVHFLEAGAQVGLEIDLEAGVEYMVLGACDRQCTDLDLTLMDMAGTEITSDVLEDDVPVLTFTAASSGAHILWLTMVSCGSGSCSAATRALRK